MSWKAHEQERSRNGNATRAAKVDKGAAEINPLQAFTDGGPQAAVLALQRAAGNKATSDLLEESRSPVLDVIERPGRPLEPSVQREMESKLGHDFSDVRIHADAQARESASSVGAAAYTVGSNVVLGEGASINGSAGRKLLAHELTHVVQQRSGPVDGTPAPGGIKISDPSDRFEREADRVGRAVAAGGGGGARAARGSAPTVARMAVTPTVQRAGLGRVFTADYWRGMSQGRHVNALNEQLAHERDTQSLLRSNPQGLQETRRHVLKLLSPQIKHLRAALQTTTASLGDAGAQPVGNYDRTKLAPADVTSATYAYIDALAPLLFPPDAGYVKGALLDLLVAVCGPARGRKDWRLGTAQNAPRSTGTEAVQQIVIDVLFLRSQMRVLGEESAKLGTSTVAGRALIDATAVLQSVANDAPAAGKRAPWLEREARRCLPARAAFFDTLLDRILTRYNARFLAGKAPAYARPLPPRPAQG